MRLITNQEMSFVSGGEVGATGDDSNKAYGEPDAMPVEPGLGNVPGFGLGGIILRIVWGIITM